MATPRKHWFRVADSIGFEPWSNDELALALRLMAHLNTRWAREGRSAADACSTVVGPAVLAGLAGCQSIVRARSILGRLGARVSLTFDARGADTVISWPKWSEYQRLSPESGAGVKPDTPAAVPPPQSAPARRKTQDARRVSADKPPTQPVPAWATTLAGLLVEKVRAVPGARVPPRALIAWAHEIARLPAEVRDLRENGSPPEAKIRAAIEWAFGAENLGREYEVVIRSGKALREKWSTLVEAAKRRRFTGAEAKQRQQEEDVDQWVKTGRT